MRFSDMQTESFGSHDGIGHVKNYAKEIYIFSFILYIYIYFGTFLRNTVLVSFITFFKNDVCENALDRGKHKNKT